MTSSSSSLATGRLTPGKAISVEDFKKALLPNLLSKSLPGKGQAEHLASEAASVAGSEDPSENAKSRKARSENLHMRDLSQKIEVHVYNVRYSFYIVVRGQNKPLKLVSHLLGIVTKLQIVNIAPPGINVQ